MATKKKTNFTEYYKLIYNRKFEKHSNVIAPYTLLFFFAIILFSIGLIFTSRKSFIKKTDLNIRNSKPSLIKIPDAQTLYTFEIEQAFSSQIPSYSELEVELLDKDFNHTYSVYETLWRERHNNEDGGTSIFADRILQFELSLQYSGIYYIRITSHNNNTTPVTLKLYKKKGTLYFLGVIIIFIILLIVILISFDQITGMNYYLTSLCNSKINDRFILAINFVIFLFITLIIISYTHYGYPHSGDEIRLPSWFFSTNDVIYLG